MPSTVDTFARWPGMGMTELDRTRAYLLTRRAKMPDVLTDEQKEKGEAFAAALSALYLRADSEGRLTVPLENCKLTCVLAADIGDTLYVRDEWNDNAPIPGFLLTLILSEGLDEQEVATIHALIYG